jgi:hypothetical protein
MIIFERFAISCPYKNMNTDYALSTSIIRPVFLFFGVFGRLTMRILLQNRKSRLYYKGADEWTSHIKDASDFQRVVKAFDYAYKSRLPSIDVVMHFGDPVYDVRLRVTG